MDRTLRRERNADARALFDALEENRGGRKLELQGLLAAALATERRLMAQRIKPRVEREARYYHGTQMAGNPILAASAVLRIIDEEAER